MSNLSTLTPTPAADAPVTVAELASHLRLPSLLDAARILELTALITAARQHVEAATGRGMAPATYRETFTAEEVRAEALLRLAVGPVTAISTLRYHPADGGAQIVVTSAPSVSALLVECPDLLPGAAYITSAFVSLPLGPRPDAVTVDYVAGHAVGKCPAGMKQAVLLLAAMWHEQRLPVGDKVSELPFSLNALIQQSRVGGFNG